MITYLVSAVISISYLLSDYSMKGPDMGFPIVFMAALMPGINTIMAIICVIRITEEFTKEE